MRLVPLGTNGFFPSFGRQTMSFLLLDDPSRRALLLDAGTGVGRLLEPRIATAIAGIEVLDVVLTHYHLDHVVGLSYLSQAWGRDVRLWAPTEPLVDTTARAAIDRLLGPPLFPLELDRFPIAVEVREYDGDIELLGRRIEVRRQRHPGGSVGLRIGELVYATDTAADEATVDLARGARMLLHEVWLSDEEGRRQPRQLEGHAALGDVLRLAESAGVESLAPVHHHPGRDERALDDLFRQAEGRAASCSILRLEEGRVYRL